MTAPSPERARLAATLRELRGRTGLSLVGLAAKTTFSKSSWDRYLNGRTLPPRDAVQELCRLAGEPEGRCVALWEIAEAEGSARGGRAERGLRDGRDGRDGRAGGEPRSGARESALSPPPAPLPAAPPREVVPAVRRGAVAVVILASVCAVVVGGLTAVALLLPRGDGEPGSSRSPSPVAAGPRCRGAVCEGRDPMHMACGAHPTTVATYRTASGAWMELRHSEECGASWARMWRTRVGDRIEMRADGVAGRDGGDSREGPVRGAEVRDAGDADNYVYTPMTAAPPGTVVRACFRPASGGAGECFDGRVSRA